MAQTFEVRSLLVVRLDNHPGAERRVGLAEHLFFAVGVSISPVF